MAARGFPLDSDDDSWGNLGSYWMVRVCSHPCCLCGGETQFFGPKKKRFWILKLRKKGMTGKTGYTESYGSSRELQKPDWWFGKGDPWETKSVFLGVCIHQNSVALKYPFCIQKNLLGWSSQSCDLANIKPALFLYADFSKRDEFWMIFSGYVDVLLHSVEGGLCHNFFPIHSFILLMVQKSHSQPPGMYKIK